MNTIHDLAVQGKSVQEIAQELRISRTTVRKYLKHPEAVMRKPRPPRPSRLDPFKEQIKQWVMQDHCTNCEVIWVAASGEDAQVFGRCQVIAMTTHGSGGMSRWMMGSITRRVLHATRLPLLIVRPPDMMDKAHQP